MPSNSTGDTLEDACKEPRPWIVPRTDGRLAGRRILIVDDDPPVRRVVHLILERAGAVVEAVSTASLAFAALPIFRPHLLVSDINMPIEDGYSLIRRIRTLNASAGGGVPAIALTGGSDASGRLAAMLAGFNAYLLKPIVPADLLAASMSLTVAPPR